MEQKTVGIYDIGAEVEERTTMSQRLHIGSTSDGGYDCVCTSVEGAREKLIAEWLWLHEGFYAGPFKIRIGDMALFRALEPVLIELFERLGELYPDNVWTFSRGRSVIEHPSRAELDEWLKESD